MNLGHLRNEAIVAEYKHLGFATRTQLIDTALDLFREKLVSDRRKEWKQKAFNNYTETENIWEQLDGEDFRDA